MCDSCMSQIDVNTHVLHCPAYAALRQDRDLNKDVHLAQYLQQVLEIRMKLRLDRWSKDQWSLVQAWLNYTKSKFSILEPLLRVEE